MRTVGTESECAGELRGAGGLVPSIHNTSYHTIYQLSIDMFEVLGPKLARADWRGQKELRIRTLEKHKGAVPTVVPEP